MLKKRTPRYSLSTFAGLTVTPLRLVLGWLLFSAMWRRVLLQPGDLDALSPMYEGLKFNHFVVSSEIITPLIKFLVSHPSMLYVFLWIFTIIEGILGTFLILGLFSRLAGLGSLLLLGNVMLGAGWLGTTCVDEWQIGVLGVSSGLVIFLAGGGPLSLDALLFKKVRRFWQWLTSGPFFVKNEQRTMHYTALWLATLVFIFTLATNQINVNGVWGPFHNPAVKPHLTISDASIDPEGLLKFTLLRDEGPDTYGSFVTQLKVLNKNNKVIFSLNGKELGNLSPSQIENKSLVKIAPNGQCLFVPLAGLADITLFSPSLRSLPSGSYTLELTDISNMSWSAPAND